MQRNAVLIGLMAMAATVSAAAQQEGLPFGDLVSMANEQMRAECERLLQPPPAASELAKRDAAMGATVFCDCMPPALAALERDRGPQTRISGEDFSTLVMREFDICGARAVRDVSRRDCAKFTPLGAPPTYCACFTAAIDGLTDEQIVSDSIAARENLEQRADARRSGTPEPPLELGVVARIDRECLLPARVQ
jgi:hypothetical protein